MYSAMDASNTAPVAILHQKAFHKSSALNAARMIRHQDTPASKHAFRTEWVEHLRASLCETQS